MYANQGYQPPHSRGVSFSAALVLNAALIAGLIFSAPDFLPKPPPTVLTGTNIPIEKPQPEPPKPQPKVDQRDVARAPLPTAPDPIIPTRSENPTETTPIIYPPLPPQLPASDTGPVAQPEPPKALPPLVGAAQDPRYLRDFQPEYPSSELRAQRDGQVSVRILIGIDGRVKAVEQIRATSTAFFEATKRQALGKWRFKPATRGGVPEESWKVMNVRFELENAR
ncbi:energy transducer TonB [Sphingomonas sp. dw_22]|uniref:energy transducer TonB n=1 Tax=Sphingomonas sp. dw_22 TaxID=2721175 RepID=UPI001BD5678D|nr:energy transducer TonB [Sphingomonas sp. dw_22]